MIGISSGLTRQALKWGFRYGDPLEPHLWGWVISDYANVVLLNITEELAWGAREREYMKGAASEAFKIWQS